MDSLAGKGAWLRIIMKEGRKRQIREVGSRIGLPVVRILRVRIGSLLLGELKSGEWRNLSDVEVRQLKKSVEQPEHQPGSTQMRKSVPKKRTKLSSR